MYKRPVPSLYSSSIQSEEAYQKVLGEEQMKFVHIKAIDNNKERCIELKKFIAELCDILYKNFAISPSDSGLYKQASNLLNDTVFAIARENLAHKVPELAEISSHSYHGTN